MSTNLPSFEKADYAAVPALESCARCQQPLTGRFFRVASEPMCEPCANAAVTSPVIGASGAFAKAIAVGVGAAIAGSILYAMVEIATGWTIGYVALAVGWLVGKGMKWGSEGRGGRRYQIAAAVLTYLSVSFAGVVVMIHAAMKDMPAGARFGFSPGFLPVLAKDVMLAPLLELRGGLNGVIGLFILFIGVRTAWSMTAGSEYRITGPYQGAPEA
jgi:hypothetical protein